MDYFIENKVMYAILTIVMACVVVVAYFQTTNEQSFSDRMLGSLTLAPQCVDNTLETLAAPEEAQEVYFVGCGGFF